MIPFKGMTAVHEAIMFAELNIPYALVCMVDNMGHGLISEQLSMEKFKAGLARNAELIEQVLGVLLNSFIQNS